MDRLISENILTIVAVISPLQSVGGMVTTMVLTNWGVAKTAGSLISFACK